MKIQLLSSLVFILAACGSNFDERLEHEARQYTEKHCPQRLDDITTLDSVVYEIGVRTYTRYLTVPGEAAATVRQNGEAVKAALLTELKNDAAWKTCKDEGINFKYIYRTSGSSEVIYTTTLTRSDYSMP